MLASLDTGLWARDLPMAADRLEGYLTKYQQENPPQLALAREKLYAASVELGQRAVAISNFREARGHFERAGQLKPNDLLAAGELKKVTLWLAGDEAYRARDWESAAGNFGELVRIDRSFGNSEEAEASRVELAKTWTPTPEPVAPPPPARRTQSRAKTRRLRPTRRQRTGRRQRPNPAAAPTKSPLGPR